MDNQTGLESKNDEKITSLMEEIAALKKARDELNVKIAGKDKEIASLEKARDELNGTIASKDKEIERRDNEIKSRNKKIRSRNIMSALLLLLVIAAGSICYILQKEADTSNRRINALDSELSSLRENDSRNAQVQSILSALKSNPSVKKFYASDSLVYVDHIDGTKRVNVKGKAVAGNLSVPSNFCEEFENSSAEYGFFNRKGLEETLRAFRQGDFFVKDDRNFAYSTDSGRSLHEKLSLLGESAFFSLRSLKPGRGAYIANLEESIVNALKENDDDDLTFRFFFATSENGLYVLSVVRDNKLKGCYLVSDDGTVRRDLLLRNIRENLTQRNFDTSGADIEVSLWSSDSRLNDEIDFNSCINIFVTQLLERSK